MGHKKKLYLVKIAQLLTWPIVFLIANVFLNIRIKGKKHFGDIKPPIILVANHISFYDSFLFSLIIGKNIFHLPLRFMAVKKFESKFLNFLSLIKIIDLIYYIFGAFIIIKGQGIETGISEAYSIIMKGESVVIYPEGRMVYSGIVEPFRKGAAVLALKTKVPIVPVSFRLEKNSFFRNNLYINVGVSVSVKDSTSSEELSAGLHRVVSDLHTDNNVID